MRVITVDRNCSHVRATDSSRVLMLTWCVALVSCVTIVLMQDSRGKESDVSSKQPVGPATLSQWLPSQCESRMFACAPDGSLQPFAGSTGTSLGEGLLHLPVDALSGLSINALSSHLNSRNVSAVASGATGFRVVKKGPGGITVCVGCVIVVFDGDLGPDGMTYLRELEKRGGMKLTVNETVVVQTRGRLNDGSEGKLFTTQPKGNVIVYANDLDLMKDCVEKIKEQGKGRSTPAVTPVFVRYLDGGETFTAIRESGRGDDRQLQFVLTWRNKRSAIVDVAWLMEDENHGVGGYSAEEIRTFWKLPDPVALLPTVTKADRDALWLRLELKNKEAAEAALFIIRAHLGFVAIP